MIVNNTLLWSINIHSFLVKEHNILYDIEYVVKRTLALKNQQNEEKESSSIGIQVNFESYPVAFFKNIPLEKELVVKLKREEFKIDPDSIKKEPRPSLESHHEDSDKPKHQC